MENKILEKLKEWLKQDAEKFKFRDGYEELSVTNAWEIVLDKIKEIEKEVKGEDK